MTIDELIEKLEQATGPSRELDADVWEALGLAPEPRGAGPWDWKRQRQDAYHEGGNYHQDDGMGGMGRHAAAPHYTASIDAALTLVPKGWTWVIDATAPALGVDCQLHNGDRKTLGVGLDAPHAACIAALEAKKLEMKDGNDDRGN